MKIILLIGDDNQIYQALVSEENKPVQTLIDSKTGAMGFTPLETEAWQETQNMM